MKIKIAFIQLVGCKELEKQYQNGQAACRKAKQMGADIALFPEMWSSGYYLPQDENELRALSIAKQSSFVQGFKALAKELDMAIAITFLERSDPKPLNSVVLFDRNGNEVLHYSKVHTCAFDLEKVLSAGEAFCTAKLETANGSITVGAMICYDREFPESARILMLKGAELILAPNACPMEINRLCALRTRAYENMTAVATCNYAQGQPDCNGHSTLFDGVAWLREEEGVRDMCILEAPEDEGIYISELDVDKLRSYKECEVMGDKFRRPGMYGELVKNSKAR
ncbi:MAG: carbon-nitrogen hydrolase family protein [Ruminococcus sp.]|nr:carbon-nitrogen hydrolase family protein [Ruminococcus sp.]